MATAICWWPSEVLKRIVNDGNDILDTGGGILNMLSQSDEENVLVFNPDTLWQKDYLDEIVKMQKFYFSTKIENILLLVNKDLSFAPEDRT